MAKRRELTLILDATAGNRVMWQIKGIVNPAIFIDKQKRLERPPTIFATDELTPFSDKTFDTIFFDPPHHWNWKSTLFGCPDAKSWQRRDGRKIPTYYGMELYKTRAELVKYVWQAQKEFFRILKDDGLLWLKWCEIKISLERALIFLTDGMSSCHLGQYQNIRQLVLIQNFGSVFVRIYKLTQCKRGWNEEARGLSSLFCLSLFLLKPSYLLPDALRLD